MTQRVCILSTVHAPFDTRVFHKQAKTLVSAGYDVTLVVQHSRQEVVDGVSIVPLRKPRSRFDRMTRVALSALRTGLRQRAAIFHFHDPELIPIGLILKLLRKRVIYDVHETTPEDMLVKQWIPERLRKVASRIVGGLERISCGYFDHIIVASRYTGRNFPESRTTTIANYPLLCFTRNGEPRNGTGEGPATLVYVGDLTQDRGLLVMIEAMRLLEGEGVELHLLGPCENRLSSVLDSCPTNVKYLGFRPLEQVFQHLKKACAGLLLLQPTPGFLHAAENTNKLFEYMAAGLPVVASSFPGLQEIIEGNGCGICVDPQSPREVASAIRSLLRSAEVRLRMGTNGLQAVRAKFNWEREAETLKALYVELLEDR